MTLWLFLAALALTVRCTRFVVFDELGGRLKSWLKNSKVGLPEPVAFLLSCPYCASVWFAILSVALALLAPNVLLVLGAIAGVAWAAGHLVYWVDAWEK